MVESLHLKNGDEDEPNVVKLNRLKYQIGFGGAESFMREELPKYCWFAQYYIVCWGLMILRNTRAATSFFLINIFSAVAIAETEESITFGVPPYLKPAQLIANLEPLREQLDEFFPGSVDFSLLQNYPLFRQAMDDDSFDIVILSAFDYLHSRQSGHYLPVVRLKGYQKVELVSISPDISSTRDLRGRRVGFAAASSPTTILGKILISDAGLQAADYQSINYESLDICLREMLESAVDVCVSYMLAAQNFFKERKVSYRVIARSSVAPQPVIAIRKGLVAQREELAGFLCDLNEGRQFKLTLGSGVPMDFIEVLDADFDAIGAIYEKNAELFN